MEDDPLVHEALRTTMIREGHTVLSAYEGRAALDLLFDARDALPDVILLDLRMPDIDGWEFLRTRHGFTRLRAIPVIVVTASDTIRADLLPDVLLVLSKPVSVETLLHSLHAVPATGSGGDPPTGDGSPR